ncbi:MAG: hypothetical protein V2A55_00770 [Candidatus Jorgensenbacteria bacterium]
MIKRGKRKYKATGIKSAELYTIAGALILIAILSAAIFLKPVIEKWLLNFFIEIQISALERTTIKNEEIRGNPLLDSGVPRESVSTPLQGSFTELFSGAGWKNPLNSTVYQDFKTLTVSFPPAYEIEEISSTPHQNEFGAGQVEDTVTIGSRTFTGVVKKTGGQYEGYLYEVVDSVLVELPIDSAENSRLFTSQYPGKIVLGSDGTSKLFLLYVAYQGNAYELRVDPLIDFGNPRPSASITRDYSNIFNARVMEDGKIDPRVFYTNGAWWIYSINETPKLLRIRDGVASDLTEGIRSGIARMSGQLEADIRGFTAVPAAGANAIYISVNPLLDEENPRSSASTFLLRDLGFSIGGGKIVWESLRLNAWEGEVVRGRFTRIDDSRSETAPNGTPNGANIKYFLSNDGGRNWTETELNEFVNFNIRGGDFRWRAELEPLDSQYESPWIKVVGVEYYIIRNQ